MLYGDMLMLLANLLRPYEKERGAVEKCRTKWFSRLSRELMQGKGLTLGHMQKIFREIALDFSRIETTGEKKQRVGILGDIYTKYCHLGNWNVVRFLEEEGCESSVGGLSWYVLYYIDSHKPEGKPLTGAVFDLVGRLVLHLQKSMLRALGDGGFHCVSDFAAMKQEAAGYVSLRVAVGDGWLLGAETVSLVKHRCRKVLAIHPFGCLPGHVCGKGCYPALNRKLPEGKIIAVDVDSSGSQVSFYNRVKMLVDCPVTRKE